MVHGLLTALLVLSLSGCWDRHETNELALATALAMDYEGHQYEASVEVQNPKVVGTPGQGASQPESETQNILLRGEGPGPASALRSIQNKSSRHLFWPTLDMILIGEGLARHGIGPFLATATHTAGFRLSATTMVTHGPASTLLGSRKSGSEVNMGRDLRLHSRFVRFDESTGTSAHLYEILRDGREAARSSVILGVGLKIEPGHGKPIFDTEDSAVFQGDRMIGWMPAPFSRIVLWSQNRFVHGDVDLACPGGSEFRGSVTLGRASASTRPVFAEGQLQGMDVRFSALGVLSQPACSGLSSDALNQLAAQRIYEDVSGAIRWTKEHDADTFGWGEDLYRAAPRLWQDHLAMVWPERLRALPVHVTVHVQILRTGGQTR